MWDRKWDVCMYGWFYLIYCYSHFGWHITTGFHLGLRDLSSLFFFEQYKLIFILLSIYYEGAWCTIYVICILLVLVKRMCSIQTWKLSETDFFVWIMIILVTIVNWFFSGVWYFLWQDKRKRIMLLRVEIEFVYSVSWIHFGVINWKTGFLLISCL